MARDGTHEAGDYRMETWITEWLKPRAAVETIIWGRGVIRFARRAVAVCHGGSQNNHRWHRRVVKVKIFKLQKTAHRRGCEGSAEQQVKKQTRSQ